MLVEPIAEMTGRAVSLGYRLQQRHVGDTAFGLDRTTRVEMTARWRIESARDLALGLRLGGDGGAMEGVGDRRDQGARVGMARILEDLLPAALLDDAAEIHHGDAVADMLDDAEIVADHDVGQPHLVLELEQE